MQTKDKVVVRLPLAFPPISGVQLVLDINNNPAFRLIVEETEQDGRMATQVSYWVTEAQLATIVKLIELHRTPPNAEK